VTVTVAMPWYGAPELLGRAVRSVLAQTYGDLVLVVVADGEPITGSLLNELAGVDERCILFALETNRGPYFAQEVVLEATSSEWYAVVGADDWIEPDHVERLLAAMDARRAAVPGSVWWEEEGRDPFVHEGRYEVGVYDPERLRAIGGFNVAERIGQDTLTLKLLDLTGGMVVDLASPPTYHRVRRPGSLTTSPETGFRTRARNEMRRRNRTVFYEAQALTPGKLETLASWRRRQMPRDLRDEASMYAASLADLIR